MKLTCSSILSSFLSFPSSFRLARTLSHTHTRSLSYLLALFSVVYVVHGSFITLKRKKERAAFQLLCFDLFLSETGVLLKKCRRKKVVWTLLLRGERPKLLFDFDSRLLGFISRGTFEKQKTTRSRSPQKHNRRTTTTTTTTIEEKK